MKVLLGLLLAIFMFIGCSSDKEEDVLKVGMELAYPPFEMSDKSGKPTGISVDLAYALGEYLGKKVVIENIAWDGLIPSLKTKKIDIIISSMTITDERKKSIEFSIPYAQASLAILANNKSNIQNISDLDKKGKTVAVKKGSTGHLYVRDYFKNANILVLDKENACVLEVVQGKADGFIYDQLTIYKNYSNHKETTVALLKPFQTDAEYWGIALRHNEPELKKNIDAFIKEAKKDGIFDDLSRKYLKDARATFDKLKVAFFF
ncbi:MAG: polar amino acid transport system substrate-binding protein [Sulfurimonas sp.]|jgi:polar amino acid transport system substrate-binding protein